MKYLKLFENWNETQGDGFKYYDDDTLETAEEILRSGFKKVKITSEEIKQIEEALKKYLKADILKIKVQYDPYGNKAQNSDARDWWEIKPTSVVGPYDLGYYSSNISCWVEKFEEDPIVAISILEKHRLSQDILDDHDLFLLELSVRKQIVNDTKGKANRVLGVNGDSPLNNSPWWLE